MTPFTSGNKRLRSAVVLTLSISLLFSIPAGAQEARLTDIVITNTRDHLLLYFTVTGCFTADMEKAIENGIVTTFTFFVRLYEPRSFWWDRTMADLKVSHEIQYDNLKKVYNVKLSETNKSISVKDFDEAKKLTSEIVGLKVIELPKLHKGSRYRIRMMAELDEIKLPFYLHYVLFFLSLWDFETDWYTVDFIY
ncbi:MAG: DUF4390 domain-containing protein [Pseudomonadota bacterium]